MRNNGYSFLYTDDCRDTRKSIPFFIEQSMAIPKTIVLPSGVEVPSYCRSVLKGDMQLIKEKACQPKKINFASNKKPRCLLHYGLLADVPSERKYRNLKKLVDLGADREQRDEHGRTPLHFAVLLGDTKAVDVLLEAGCDIRAKCHGNNLMHLATISGDPDMFHKVRKLGFDPQELTEYGFTSVHLAACYNHHQMIPLLKSCSLDVNRHSELLEKSPVKLSILPLGFESFKHYVLQNVYRKLSRTAIESQIDFLHKSNEETRQFMLTLLFSNRTNVVGVHPLVLATKFGFVPVVKALVNNGADANCVTSFGKTPLSLAAFNGQMELVEYYFQKLNALDNALATSTLRKSVVSATSVGAVDVVGYIIRKSGNIFKLLSFPNSDSELSLIDVAVIMNQPEILQFVLKMDLKGFIERSKYSKEPNFLLHWSSVGGCLLTTLSKNVPQFASLFEVTEECQLAVMSTILDLPGCDPLQIVPSTRCSNVDMAILLSQPYALDVILCHLKKHNVILPSHSTISIPDHIQSLPLPHLCVRSVEVIQTLLAELPDNTLQNTPDTILHAAYLVISQTIFSTFDVLLKHGYGVNCLDSLGLTCLDYALAIGNVELQQFLYSRGAMLARDLDYNKQLKDENEKHIHMVAQLKDEKMKLVEEKKELMVENQELKSQNEYLSKIMTDSLKQGLLLSPFLNPAPSPPSGPFNEIGLDEGTLLDDEDIQLMAAKWQDIGTCLGLKLPILDNIKADHSRSCEQACREMLTRWCKRESRTGDKPRTLNVILEALVRCGCEEYATELKEKHKL